MIEGRDLSTHNRDKLESYWNVYYAFEKTSLVAVSKKELLKEISENKKVKRYYIDSQVVISNVLMRLGSKHNFHRQFDEWSKSANKSQVLGMQLYLIMLNDDLDWVFNETKHQGHIHSHATYFIPKNRINTDK